MGRLAGREALALPPPAPGSRSAAFGPPPREDTARIEAVQVEMGAVPGAGAGVLAIRNGEETGGRVPREKSI